MIGRGKHREGYILIDSQQSFWLWIALLFPVPLLAHYVLLRRRMAHLRNDPRTCPQCKAPMRRLSEEEEDDYLSEAQQLEETLHSADHDVWRCTACEATVRVSYPGKETKYMACPQCEAVAYSDEHSKILVEPTRTRSGKGETVYACKSCGHKKTEKYSMAKLVDHSSASSNSSGSSSSSSSGSNWSGGSSSGGGASSKW